LFLVACKDSKPADPAAKETPTPTEQPSKQARPRPTLPAAGDPGTDEGRERPRLPGAETDRDRGRDLDPAEREERRAMRDERRKSREEMLDTNQDGVVSVEERQQRLEPMRQRLDANGDGKLTPDELNASDRRMGFDDPAAIDTNSDGEISLAELEVAVTARREQMRERWRGRGGRGSAAVGPE
jgi:Ca2+-binding EF-hand superfamily protein